MQCENCHSSVLRSLSLVPDHVNGLVPSAPSGCCGRSTPPTSSDWPSTGARRMQRPLPMKPENLRRHASSLGGRIGGSHARGPFHRLAGSPAVHQPLGGDPWVSAAYAEEQRWTRDPLGSRDQSYSPRIPHGKVTTWQRPIKVPCQGVIIG